MAGFADRVPPHNLEAEMSVLGAMLLSNEAVQIATDTVRPEDFSRAAHTAIFEAISDLYGRGEPVDAITVADALDASGELDRIGGKSYLLDITNVLPTAASVKHYGEIVRRTAIYRALIRAGTEIAAMGYDSPDAPEECIGMALNKVMGLSVSRDRGTMPLDRAFTEMIKEIEKGKREYIAPPYLPWVHINRGALVILAAGTSVGKTLVALEWADAWSQIYPTLFLEYEMNEASLASRIAAKYSQISMTQMEDGLAPEEIEVLRKVNSDILSRRKLYVEAMRTDTTAALFAKIRKAASVGIRVVFVDHLGLVPIRVPKGQNYAKAVGSELTNKLKRLAVELNITIVLLAQLNREGQKKTGRDRHPSKNDLRDSGEIEQDADVIVTLYREARADEDPGYAMQAREEAGLPGEYPHDVMWMGVAKNRNGALGHAYVGCKPEFNLLFDPFKGDPLDEVRAYLAAIRTPVPVEQPALL